VARVERFIPEGLRGYRTPEQIDRDRVHYSTAFARLAEVTQVVSADRGYVFHNRLTHSLKVAQIARRLAEKLILEQAELAHHLGGLSPDVAEAAALAHDLGHPPFGHLAEKALDSLCRTHGLTDGYEGNAQSFRIVTKLAVGDALSEGNSSFIRGLNLTRATLNGILKYPWLHGANPNKPDKWGAYLSEATEFDWVRSVLPFRGNLKSLEAELMDWADDITFSVHDLIDFYCAGRIPLEQLGLADGDESQERTAFLAEVFERCGDLCARKVELAGVFTGVCEIFPLNRRYVGLREQCCQLWQFITVLISRYVDGIRLTEPDDNGRCVTIDKSSEDEIRMLKELTWHYVILQNDLATDQRGQRKVVERVFQELRSAADDKKAWNLFPPFFKEAIWEADGDNARVTRCVADYMSGMTEKELLRTYRALSGPAVL
jgi:dGTPase